MIKIRQTETFAAWLDGLRDLQAVARIDVRLRRLSLGNPGDVKPVGEGVSELRIDYGPATASISCGVALWSLCCCAAATSGPKTKISPQQRSWLGKFRTSTWH